MTSAPNNIHYGDIDRDVRESRLSRLQRRRTRKSYSINISSQVASGLLGFVFGIIFSIYAFT